MLEETSGNLCLSPAVILVKGDWGFEMGGALDSATENSPVS